MDCGNFEGELVRNAGMRAQYFVMNACATVVATYGLLQNSTAVIIGAMLLAMLLGPIHGVAFSLAHGYMKLFRRSLLTEAAGVMLVLTISFSIGLIHADMDVTGEMLSRTQPMILDLFIALAGGAGAAYALVSCGLGEAITGAAITTALVPPLCTCGLLLARGEPTAAAGAFLLFFTNFMAIAAAGMLVFWATRRRVYAVKEKEYQASRLVQAFGLLLMIAIGTHLGATFKDYMSDRHLARDVRAALQQNIGTQFGFSILSVAIDRKQRPLDVTATMRSSSPLSQADVNALATILEKSLGQPIILHARVIGMEVLSSR